MIREDRVRLNELLGEAVVESLEKEGSQSRSGPACYRVQKHEALIEACELGSRKGASSEGETWPYFERVAAVGLAIDHLEELLVDLLAGAVAHGPVVARSSAVLRHEDVFRVVEVGEGRRLDGVDDLRRPEMSALVLARRQTTSEDGPRTRGSRSTRMARGM